MLIEAWYASWKDKALPSSHESIHCYRGMLPARLEERSKIDIIVPFDFEWEGLERVGLVDAERNRHDTTDENVKSFVHTARVHMPPPPRAANELTLEQVQNEDVSITLQTSRPPTGKHDHLTLIFRNTGTIPLRAVGAAIEWSFDTERALAAHPQVAGPRVVEAQAAISLQRVSHTDTSLNGCEVVFALDRNSAGALVDVITRASEIVSVKAVVHVAPAFKITETENVREIVLATAKSVLDSWDA